VITRRHPMRSRTNLAGIAMLVVGALGGWLVGSGR
jgi:hypothetical protein